MNYFLKTLSVLLIYFVTVASGNSKPRISFEELLIQSEQYPALVNIARKEALSKNLPVNILTKSGRMIDAKFIEDGRVVYAVFTDLHDVYNGGYCAFYEEIKNEFDPTNSRIDFGNGNIIDNTGEIYKTALTDFSPGEVYLMVPDWTFDRVYLFKQSNGDLVDTAFLMSSTPNLQSPKHALQHFNKRNILVSDQISDLVQKFDTSGTYITWFAPSTGVNNAIVDNMRGIRFRANRNLLVTVASGGSQNTIQQFDTAGVHIGTFISGNVNSPFDILLRDSDMLITNSSGANRITKFDLSGNFISSFYSSSNLSFPQQMFRMQNGNIVVAGFSSPSGLVVMDSAGNYIRTLTGVTGNRSVYLLGNGNFMTTNSTGVHEIDSGSGAIVRTIVTGANYQYVSEYNPDLVVSVGNGQQSADIFKLYQNYPNPFNPGTTINFQILNTSEVTIRIFDVLGNEIKSLINGMKLPGSYSVEFDGKGMPSGIYFYELKAKSEKGIYKETKRMILVK
ncbi:MAG: hypothetical protein HGGPFJEG_02054 [Ignavibacteria bacterium]|nr:hypothetical protein [Ignavibacteria bacterium]